MGYAWGRSPPFPRFFTGGCRQALWIAGSRTGGRGTFSFTRESTQRACRGGGPPGYPPLSWGASLSFRRPGPAAAQLPPTADRLLHPYALVPAAQAGRLAGMGSWKVNGDRLEPEDVRVLGKEAAVPSVPVQRGTPALAAAALLVTEKLGAPRPQILLAGDCGSSKGSSALYAWLASWLGEEEANLSGLTFHYLFPSVDGHNRILMALEARRGPMPALVADAGFMYAAKMSGYASRYDVFTPDAGELAFLADEKAPHPFYTRGFLLSEDNRAEDLARLAWEHGDSARLLLVKGSSDLIMEEGRETGRVTEPCLPFMEPVGGTGDLVTGLLTAFAAAGFPL